MKKHLLLLGFVLPLLTYAQTIISTSNASGTWALSGSPYLVQVGVNVPAGQTLVIEPGVELRFSPATNIHVDGQLIANGTAAQPIVFHAVDTNGWSDENVTTGGWNGVHYHMFSGPGTDQSIVNHCEFRDVKYGFFNSVLYASTLTAERGLTVTNTLFEHNTTGTSGTVGEGTLFMMSYGTDANFTVDNCTFRDNISVFGNLRTNNFNGGTTSITNCLLENNQGGTNIFALANNNTLIADNEIRNNTHINDGAPIRMSVGTMTIRGNHVHHNYSEDMAAIVCKSGFVTIEGNFVHNHVQSDAFCGATAGGGGMHLAFNEGSASSFQETYYTVRNNIIANNFSSYGGGGIYQFNSRATISNNHIINNDIESGAMGKSILLGNPNTESYIYNNIIQNHLPNGTDQTASLVQAYSVNKVGIDYNYLPADVSTSMTIAGNYTLIGVTTHNVIGTQAGLVNSTADNDVSTDAGLADFQLLVTSPCIDAGDTTNALVSTVDYMGMARIYNDVIDIGAYEYNPQSGIEEKSTDRLSFFPNPVGSGEEITVVTPDAQGMLIVTDLAGNQVRQQTIVQQQTVVSTRGLSSSGCYLIHLSGKTAKLVVR